MNKENHSERHPPGLALEVSLSNRCLTSDGEIHCREAVECYRHGMYRPAIICMYIAVYNDVIDKLNALRGVNSEVKQLLDKVSSALDVNGGFESTLLTISEKQGILATDQLLALHNLKRWRNKLAHPTHTEVRAIDAYYIITQAVDLFLSKRTVGIKAEVDAIIEELKEKRVLLHHHGLDATNEKLCKLRVSDLPDLALELLMREAIKLIRSTKESTVAFHVAFFICLAMKGSSGDLRRKFVRHVFDSILVSPPDNVSALNIHYAFQIRHSDLNELQNARLGGLIELSVEPKKLAKNLSCRNEVNLAAKIGLSMILESPDGENSYDKAFEHIATRRPFDDDVLRIITTKSTKHRIKSYKRALIHNLKTRRYPQYDRRISQFVAYYDQIEAVLGPGFRLIVLAGIYRAAHGKSVKAQEIIASNNPILGRLGDLSRLRAFRNICVVRDVFCEFSGLWDEEFDAMTRV